MECTITRLIDGPGRRSPARSATGGRPALPIVFPAKAVVLATGGIGKAYEVTSNSWEYSGDGQALAYEAGAELIDMEFVQFHPTGMVWPPGVRGLLVTEAVRGEGGILRNNAGERFMWKYLPEDRRAEYAATDEEAATLGHRPVRRAARPTPAGRPSCPPATTWRAPSTPRSARAADRHTAASSSTSATCRPRHVRRKLPSMYEQFKELADVDITKGPMEVGPTTHYVMGGIRVDAESGATTVPGLFAAGEVAGGMHGANRLGGNSLSDLLVFGARTGRAARPSTPLRRAEPYVDPVQVRERDDASSRRRSSGPRARTHTPSSATCRTMMQRLVGIFRVEADLTEALGRAGRAASSLDRGPARPAAGPTTRAGTSSSSSATCSIVSEAITRSALRRTESRGAHSRLDHPVTDEAGLGRPQQRRLPRRRRADGGRRRRRSRP